VARALRAAGEDVVEVRVPWRKSDRREVRALSGQDRVPLLVLDGEAICDSRRIVDQLRTRTPKDVPATP
jgi:glutathione S-transferase